MTPTPTGTLTRTEYGDVDLTITRIFPGATTEDVWASITEPERTARWYGPWRGEAGVGKTIEVQMTFEETDAWMPMRIDACDPPKELVLSAEDSYGSWNIELRVRESGTAAALDLIHHKLDPAMAENVGPGWEYYLDMLVASRNEEPLPSFDDYYPSQSAYFSAQAEALGEN